MSDKPAKKTAVKPADVSIFTKVLDDFKIPYTKRNDGVIVLATKYVKFTGDGKRDLAGPQDKRPE